MDVMIFKSFKIIFCPINYSTLPLWKDPGTLHDGSIAPNFWNEPSFQICFCHHINTCIVAHIVPWYLIRIVAGTHRINIIP